ncbi:MAG: hypothetical protein Q4P66_07895 [Actinomycetaceae bacterium]|nr:hypothetical protein [Actinomycetaceae bacterium]
MPLNYGADALGDVMLRGASLSGITLDMTVLWVLIVVFFFLASLNFRKARAKIGL